MPDQYDLILLGSGPGGYVAPLLEAFKTLVENPLGLVA